jgi:hypothetical protein
MREGAADVLSTGASGRLLTEAQVARVRTVRAALRRREEEATVVPEIEATAMYAAPCPESFGSHPWRDPLDMYAAPCPEYFGSHPWRDPLDALFRPGTKQHRAADRLLTLRQSTRGELAAWSGLRGASVSNLINILVREGFDIHRWAGHDRRAHFRVLGHKPSLQCGPDMDRKPVGEAGVCTKTPRTDPRLLRLAERIGAQVRYVGDDAGLAVVEVEGHGTFRGRLLGPVLPVSVIAGTATLQRIKLDRGIVDLDMGDRTHRVRLRLDLHEAPRSFEAVQ